MNPSLLLPIQLGSPNCLRSASAALKSFSGTLLVLANEVSTSEYLRPSRIWNWFFTWLAGSSSISIAVDAGIWVRSLYRPYWIERASGLLDAAELNAFAVLITSAASRISAILLVFA